MQRSQRPNQQAVLSAGGLSLARGILPLTSATMKITIHQHDQPDFVVCHGLCWSILVLILNFFFLGRG